MSEYREAPPLLLLQKVVKHYSVTRGLFSRRGESVRAVDGIDLSMQVSETLGLVGESGCGKSTLGRVILRLEEPTAGEIRFDGQDLLAQDPGKLHRLRRRMQMVFQDPYSSLNPRRSVGRIVGEGLVIHGIGSPAEQRERVRELLNVVGLHPEDIHRYPHEFSGGQRQRIGIARALALKPDFIICDEPLSALDVSIQAQIINLLQNLQEQYHLTYLFISHDLSVVRHISDRVAVMYLGRLVELAQTENLFNEPCHPYTLALLEAVPTLDASRRRRSGNTRDQAHTALKHEVGCDFRNRCPLKTTECEETVPPMREIRPQHWIRCFRTRF